MRKYVVLLGIVILSTGLIMANKTTVQDAQTVAVNFFKFNVPAAGKMAVTASLSYTRLEADNTVDFYVFDMNPVKGFVIVTADDNITPVIGYSAEGYFNAKLDRTGLQDWMNHAASHIYKGIQQRIPADSKISGLWSAYKQAKNPGVQKNGTVGPLVKTMWNQEPYYNALCPFNAGDNQRCVTGCVATTMAQIMRYWKYPQQGVGSYSYNDAPPYYSNNYGVQSANFGETTYNWAAMPLVVNSANSNVATLMYQCGVSVGMDYGDDNQGGSGALVISSGGNGHSAQDSYVNYFSYDPNTIQGVYESDYNATDWANIIKAELDAGRPVQYEGFDASGGHTWVCDGYEANDMFHMNWGWGGASDGYFLVSSLTAGGYNFNNNEGALIGIQPIGVSVQAIANQQSLCKGDTTILIAVASTESYSWTPTTGLSCPTCAYTKAYPTTTTTYTVKIDSSGFIGTSSITITVNPQVAITSHQVVNATCFGSSDGSASVSGAGGTPGYSYLWSNGNSTAYNDNLTAGNYKVVVKDAAGCSAISSQTVSQPSQIMITPHVTNAACASATGSASVVASGGTSGGYTYLWSTGGTDNSISNVATGVYTLTITNNTCTVAADITISQPYQIDITTAVNPSSGSNGSAVVENITGGTSPYSYKWSNNATTATVNDLAPGDYVVTVTDQSGCWETASVNIGMATGVSSINNAISFELYPNPAKSDVIIQLGQLDHGTTLNIENILGQTLYTKTLTEMQTQIDLAEFANGVYLVELKQGDKRAVKQLILSR